MHTISGTCEFQALPGFAEMSKAFGVCGFTQNGNGGNGSTPNGIRLRVYAKWVSASFFRNIHTTHTGNRWRKRALKKANFCVNENFVFKRTFAQIFWSFSLEVSKFHFGRAPNRGQRFGRSFQICQICVKPQKHRPAGPKSAPNGQNGGKAEIRKNAQKGVKRAKISTPGGAAPPLRAFWSVWTLRKTAKWLRKKGQKKFGNFRRLGIMPQDPENPRYQSLIGKKRRPTEKSL